MELQRARRTHLIVVLACHGVFWPVFAVLALYVPVFGAFIAFGFLLLLFIPWSRSHSAVRRVTKRYLAERRCPGCEEPECLTFQDGDHYRCGRCGRRFSSLGKPMPRAEMTA
jgi:hypothetical protein